MSPSQFRLHRTTRSATDAEWNRVAECESGQRWHLETGNGYYGGLQFSDETCDGFGGEEFAAEADDATREQQIIIAERVLDVQGSGAALIRPA